MEIKYIKKIKNNKSIDLFFENSNCIIPTGFKRFFEENNGGRPMKNICNLVDGNEKVVNSFLSFNEDDKENIYKAKRRVAEDDVRLIPFATDPAGNYYCIKEKKIIFYSHEDGQQLEVAASFDEFIKNLK